MADQQRRCNLKLVRELLRRGARDQLGLVESARAPSTLVQRNRNEQCPSRRLDAGRQLGNRLRQHLAQRAGSRRYALVLQQMNQTAQRSFVLAEGRARDRKPVRRRGSERNGRRPSTIARWPGDRRTECIAARAPDESRRDTPHRQEFARCWLREYDRDGNQRGRGRKKRFAGGFQDRNNHCTLRSARVSSFSL